MIDPSILDAMVASGCTAEQIASVVKAALNACAADRAEKREKNAERQRRHRARNAMSRVTGVTNGDTPHPPALDKETPPAPPKEIKPTPLTPQTTLQNASANEMDRLSQRLSEAVEGKIQPHAALVVGPILELIANGVDLETDIIPVLKARAAKMTRPAGSWGYFLEAIREAHAKRIEAGQGVVKPKERKGWMDGLSPDEQREKWRKTVSIAHLTESWKSWLWGPPPGQAGCLVPADLLTTRDLNHHWYEEKAPEVA